MRKYKNMIQRIQSIYLLVASVLQGLLFFVPFATSEQPNPGILEDARYDIYDDLIVLIIVSMCYHFSHKYFSFRNRTLQARISVLAALLLTAFLDWVFSLQASRFFNANRYSYPIPDCYSINACSSLNPKG